MKRKCIQKSITTGDIADLMKEDIFADKLIFSISAN